MATVSSAQARGIIRRLAMYIYRSNRTEELLAVLAQLVTRPLSDPLASECVVVQGRGMERWLAMELSRRLGIWANPDFPFPRRFIERAFAAVLGDSTQALPSPEALTWSICGLLKELDDDPRMQPLRQYLAADPGVRRQLDLARRIAGVFDRYAVYRQQRVRAWDRGEGEDWQAVLWRRLGRRLGDWHLAARAERFHTALEHWRGPLPGLPERVSLFGLSALPPLYVEILAALARHLDLHLFVLSPSREFFADIRSRRDIGRQLSLFGHRPATADQLHLDEGNPLLASWGRLGRDFQWVLEGIEGMREADLDLYRDPGTDTALHALQSDILNLRHRRVGQAGRGDGRECVPLQIAFGDDSIRLHSCYGPLRELEVLHDQLAGLLQDDATLEPRDVLVMTPDIGAYAPFVEAVFGAAEEPRIAYRVADRGLASGHPVIEAFLALLQLLGGRLGAGEVLDFIAREPVRARCGLAADELEDLRHWFSRAGVRWGADSDHRQALGQPADGANTWRFTIDRLLLGFAMVGEGKQCFAGVLPFDDIEGSAGESLGRLSEWLESLLRIHRQARTPRSPEGWSELLLGALDRLLALDDQVGAEHELLRAALIELTATAAQAGFDQRLELASWVEALAPLLAERAPASGFLEGGVTFCELVPMRTLPFRVVCLTGMNDGAYPRLDRRPGFDLLVTEPRPGDRSRREEDRYLLLEAVLSARDRLLISYTGHSPRDGSELPPSVLVGELLDCLTESFVPAAAAEDRTTDATAAVLRRQLLIEHPLQPFDQRYFSSTDSEELWSFRAAAAAGARALGEQNESQPRFLDSALEAAAESPVELELDDLVRFYRRPWRAFLEQRLGLQLSADGDLPADREPLDLVGLEGWRVGQRLLDWRLAGDSLEGAYDLLRAAGELPPGVAGQTIFDSLRQEIDGLAAAAAPWCGGERFTTAAIRGELQGANRRFLLQGRFDDRWPAALVEVRFGRLHAAAQLGLWIRHLALNWALGAQPSVLIGRGGSGAAEVLRFAPPEDPARLLVELLDLWVLGQRWPLLLFAEASAAYVARLGEAPDEPRRAAALQVAKSKLRGRFRSSSELDQPEIRRLFGDLDPLRDSYPLQLNGAAEEDLRQTSFTAASSTVFGPLMQHREVAP